MTKRCSLEKQYVSHVDKGSSQMAKPKAKFDHLHRKACKTINGWHELKALLTSQKALVLHSVLNGLQKAN